MVDKHDAADAFVRDWRSFDPVQRARRSARAPAVNRCVQPHDGWIVFPYAAAPPRQEWFYLARASQRFD